MVTRGTLLTLRSSNVRLHRQRMFANKSRLGRVPQDFTISKEEEEEHTQVLNEEGANERPRRERARTGGKVGRRVS